MRQRVSVAAGTASAALIAWLALYEGERLTPYPDPADPTLLTICSGITNRSAPGWVVAGRKYTADDCHNKEREIIERVYLPEVGRLVRHPVTDRQREMIVSFAWNVGLDALRTSTLLRRINAGDCEGAAYEFTRWTRAGGKQWPGLVTRRANESREFYTDCKVAIWAN